MATSYYSVPSSAGMSGYAASQSTVGQPTMPTSAATYSYNTGQAGGASSSSVSYAAYPAAPSSVATAATAVAPPPPPIAVGDASQYGIRPPGPPSQSTGTEVGTNTQVFQN